VRELFDEVILDRLGVREKFKSIELEFAKKIVGL
jgi:hypothetical protein